MLRSLLILAVLACACTAPPTPTPAPAPPPAVTADAAAAADAAIDATETASGIVLELRHVDVQAIAYAEALALACLACDDGDEGACEALPACNEPADVSPWPAMPPPTLDAVLAFKPTPTASPLATSTGHVADAYSVRRSTVRNC